MAVNLYFHGWFDKDNVENVPTTHGIYIAHGVKWTNSTKTEFQLVQLVYIGKAEGTNNLRKRIKEHIDGTDKKQNNRIWMWKLKSMNKDVDDILYCYAEKDVNNLDDIETALIYANEDNGIFNDRDTHGHTNDRAKALEVHNYEDKGRLLDHMPERTTINYTSIFGN